MLLGRSFCSVSCKHDDSFPVTRLSAATPSVAQTYCKTTKLDGDNFPLAIFRFKYRSKGKV
jgi:hypothetical protein